MADEQSILDAKLVEEASNYCLVVKRDGTVIDLLTGEKVPVTSGEYLRITYNGFDRHLHRIVAEAFIPIPDGKIQSELDVNHLDGDKHNNNVSNLEWATRSENCLHAYKTGLRDDNTPILVKNIQDGSITRYYSLQECARHFDVDAALIHHHLKPHNRGKISFHKYILIREGDVWPCVNEENIGKHRNGTAKVVVAVSMETGMSFMFESVGTAASTLKMKASTIHMHIWRNGNKPLNGWMFHYLDGDAVIDRAAVIKLKKDWVRVTRKPTPIKVLDTSSGVETTWESAEAFGKTISVTKNTLQKAILRNAGRYKNYQIVYLR